MRIANGLTYRVVAVLLLVLSALCPTPSHAKGGDILWQSGDLQAHRQQAVASAADSAGNLIVTGFRNLSNSTDDDYWTVKFDSNGEVVWRAFYNRNNGSDQATALLVDDNDDIIVTGYTWNGFNNDIYTAKYSGTDGTVIWEHTYSGAANGNDVGITLALDASSGTLYLGGYTQNSAGNEDYLVLVYDNTATGNNPPGSVITRGGSAGGNDRVSALAANEDGLAVTGTSWNGTDFDILTIMFEPSGSERWHVRYASTGSYPETGRYVRFDAAGNVVLAATAANPLDFDIYVAKYAKANGSVIWEQTHNGAYDDEPMGLVVGGDGDVYLTGYTWTLAGSNDFYTARLAGTTGSTVWHQIYNSSADNSDIATATGIAVDDATNGDVYVTGYTVTNGNYDFRTLKYKKENGHLLWQQGYNSTANRADRTVGIALAPNNGLYVSGWSDMTAAIANETATATGGTVNTIVNTVKAWAANQWTGIYIMMTSGANAGISRKITANSADTLTFSPDFGTAVAPGDGYYLFDKDDYDLQLINYDRGDLNPPTSLVSETVEKAGDGTYRIHLTWEDNSADETGFIIERKLGELGTWSEVGRVTANITSYDDAGLAANEYYYYRVKSYRQTEESYPGNEAHSLTFLVTYLTPLWQIPYNGGENMEDYTTAIGVGQDDNPVVTGRSDSGLIGMFDFYTLKLNRETGAKIWEDRYDSMQNEMDTAICLSVDNGNNVVVSGFSSLYYAPAEGNVHSVFTLKYPAAGPPAVWERQYNGPAGIDDRATAITSASDGSNVYIVGYGQNARYDNDIYLIKYLADGTQAWTITPIDGGRHDYPSGIALDPQGNVVITGYRQGSRGEVTDLDNFDFYTAKFSAATGALLWQETYNPYGTGDARSMGVATDSDGDIYVSGFATNTVGNKDFYTIKYNGNSGSRLWERSYDGPAHGDDGAIAVKADPIIGKNPLDANIVVVGTQLTNPSGNDSDVQLIRYSRDGEIRWERTLLRPGVADTAEAVAMDGSGYIYVAADTGDDLDKNIVSVIYDYEGTLLGGTTFDGGHGFDQASSIAVNHQGEAFIAGYTTNAALNADYIVIKQKNTYKLVPTPFTAMAQADYRLINLSWRDNSPGTRFRIEKTPGPATTDSVWELLTDSNPATTGYAVSGLSPNTQYCYRIEAYEGSLASRKVITCATTTLTAPVLNPASGVTTSAITISWPDIPGNTGYKVERKIGAGSWETAPSGILGASTYTYTDTLLTAGTQYTYRVSAQNGAGYSLPSSELVVWTLPAATTLNAPVPYAPTRVDLSWSNVVGESGYRIERKAGSAGSWETVATKSADVLAHSDTTAVHNTEYYYRLFAYNASGDSAPSAELRVVTLSANAATLTVASNATAATTIDLTWTDLSDETGYIVQESSCRYPTTPSYCSNLTNDTYWYAWTQVGSVLAADTTSYQRTGLSTANAYRYRIIANVPLSNGSTSNTTIPSNLKGAWTWLAAPTLTVTPASETSLALTWTNGNGETGFTIDRKLGAAGTWALLTTKGINITTHTDTGLSQQTEYCYRVSPTNTAGNADLMLPPPVSSDEQCLPTPLPAPTLNAPVPDSPTQVTVSWNNVAGNTGYELQRCQLVNQGYPQYGTAYLNSDSYWTGCTTIPVGTDVTTYVDTGRTAGYTYRYKVRDLYGTSPVYYSAWSIAMPVTLQPPTPTINSITVNGPTQLTINWSNVFGEMEYRLEWKPRSGADCTIGEWNPYITVAQNATYYAHASLTPGNYYCYRLSAANGTLVSAPSAAMAQTTTLATPVLNPLANITTSSVTLTWTTDPAATGYRIWRKVGETGTYSALTSVTPTVGTTSYTNSGLTAGTYYGYKIEAQNAGGYSPQSTEQTTITTPAAPVLSATTISADTASVSWTLVKGATNYKLEQRLAEDSWGEIANVANAYAESYCGYAAPRVNCPSLSPTATSYSSQGLFAGSTYCYRMKAWNPTGGDSVTSTEVCVKTSDLAAPQLTATPHDSRRIDLSWSYLPPSCSGSCEPPTGFLVERQMGGTWQRLVVTPATTTNYTDPWGIDPQTRYYYRMLAFTGDIELFDPGIPAATWSQQGVTLTGSGQVAVSDSSPPVSIVDPVNGTIAIAAANGGVLLSTASAGGGTAATYNYARVNYLAPATLHGDFELQIDFTIPNALPVTAQYHSLGRLHVSLPAGTGENYAWVERTATSYNASIVVNNVPFNGTVATGDTSGKLRITRNGTTMTASTWTGGRWQTMAMASGTSTETASAVHLTQYAQRNEAVSLKMLFDNFAATSGRSAYSDPPASAVTLQYVPADGNCP